MTKFIQAAEDSPKGRSWIVPEQIIPKSLLTHASRRTQDRHGMGKWVFSGSKVLESMVREGNKQHWSNLQTSLSKSLASALTSLNDTPTRKIQNNCFVRVYAAGHCATCLCAVDHPRRTRVPQSVQTVTTASDADGQTDTTSGT